MNDALEPLLREILPQGVAIPLETLVLRMRRRGVVVNPELLERSLRSEGSGVRLLDPWRGPQAALRLPLPASDEDRAPGLWVVPDDPSEGSPRTEPGGADDLSRALRCLGRRLDDRSPRDLARWMALVEEARRLRRRAA